MAPNQFQPRTSPRKSYQQFQPSTPANEHGDASMDTAQMADAIADLCNNTGLLGLGLDTAKNGAGAPQSEKTPWNNQWARGGDEDDLPDFEEVDYENPGYSSGTEGMAPNTGRGMDLPTTPVTPQRCPSEASSLTLPQVATNKSTSNGITAAQHHSSPFLNRSLIAKAPMQTPPRASTSTNANPASKPAHGLSFKEPKMLTKPLRKAAANDPLRPHTHYNQVMSLSPTTPTKTGRLLSDQASMTMGSPPGAETSITSSRPTLGAPLKSIAMPSRPLHREAALPTVLSIETCPQPWLLGGMPRGWKGPWLAIWNADPAQRTKDPRVRPKPAAKPTQQEIDTTTPIPVQPVDEVPLVGDDDSMRVPTPPPHSPSTADGPFANFENQEAEEFLAGLEVEFRLRANAFEIKPAMPQRPLAPPMVSPPPVVRVPSPLRSSAAPPIVECAPALQLNLGLAAEMDVSSNVVACAATIHSSSPPSVFLPVVAVATQPHFHTQSGLHTADDMDVDVDMIDDFAPSPTIVYPTDKSQLEFAAVSVPEKFAFDGRIPTVAASVDGDPAPQVEVAGAWYNPPAFPELGTESGVGPYGFNPHHTELPCLMFPQSPYPEPFCAPPLSMPMLDLPMSDHVTVWLDITLPCHGPSVAPAETFPSAHVATAEASPSVSVAPAETSDHVAPAGAIPSIQVPSSEAAPSAPLVPAATPPRQPRPQTAWLQEAIFRHDEGIQILMSPSQKLWYRKHGTLASPSIYRTRVKPVGHAPPAVKRKIVFLPPPIETQQDKAPSRRTKRARQDDDDGEKPRQKRMRREDKASVALKRPRQDDDDGEKLRRKRMRQDDKASVITKRPRSDGERQGLQPQGVDEVQRERKPTGLKRARAGNESQKLHHRRVVELRREQMPKKLPVRQIHRREDVQWEESEKIRYSMTMPGAILPGCFDDPIPVSDRAIDDAPVESESTLPDPILPGSFDPKEFRNQALEPVPCAIPPIPLLPNCCRFPTQVEPQPLGLFQNTISYFKKLWA